MTRPTEAFVSGNLFELGMGHVVLTRFRGADAELGVFLVDVYCQGAKDAFYTRVSQAEYDREVLDRVIPAENRKAIDPTTARKLVEAAVAYAEGLGLAPHPDYKKACRVFGGTNAAASTAPFTYGKDGKPFYVQGQHDSFEKALRMMRHLRARCGKDGFNFLVLANETRMRELEREGFEVRQSIPAPPGDRA
jgi:hypothetical protein